MGYNVVVTCPSLVELCHNESAKAWPLQSGPVGDWFTPVRSVGQGCAMNVATFNLMLAPLIHVLQS